MTPSRAVDSIGMAAKRDGDVSGHVASVLSAPLIQGLTSEVASFQPARPLSLQCLILRL